MINPSKSSCSRRDFVRAGSVSAAVVWLSAACSSAGIGTSAPAPTSTQSTAGNRTKLPTFLPIQGPRPDLPPSADGVIEPAYRTYPKDLFQAVKNTPGDGSDVSTFVSLGAVTGILPVDQNPAWQAVNKQLGVNLKVSAVAFADYLTTKLNTVIASGDLPDLLSVLTANPGLQQAPEFYQSQCTGVGRIFPKVRLTVEGRVEARSAMYLNLFFDHQTVDGAPAAQFLQSVKHRLELPAGLFI